MQVTIDLKFPTTARAWQLHDMKGSPDAARAMTSALRKAVRAVKAGAKTGEAYDEHVLPVASKYAKHGAADRNSIWVALAVLEKVVATRKARKAA